MAERARLTYSGHSQSAGSTNMDDFKYRDLKITDDTLKRLQSRSKSLIEPIKRHLLRWEDITSHAQISFSIDEPSKTAAKGEFLHRTFRITSEIIASGSDVHALISLTTEDPLSGKTVLVDSYGLNTFGRILRRESLTPLENDQGGPEETEYEVICEALYSIAARKY